MIDWLTDALQSASSAAGGLALTVAWQSSLWLAVGLVAARIWRRRAGRAHLLLTLATSAALVSPLLTETVRRMEWGVLPPPPTLPEDAPVVVVAPPEPAREIRAAEPGDVSFDELRQIATLLPPRREPDPEPEAPPVKRPWTARIAERIPSAVAGLWSCASLILAIRLIVSLLAGLRMAREAQAETRDGLLTALREAVDALGLLSTPLLRASPLIRCPMIWCWGARPVILLPVSAEPAPILWRSVFCHELAHLVRRDHWSALWAEVVVIILPWQPLAWRARRRLAFLREQACDDWVLSVGGEPTDYAESLLQLVPQGSPVHALAAVSSRESLKRRLEHVLAGVRITPKVGRRWIVAAGLFALAAIGGVGFAQQGKRTPVVSPETASNPEIAKEIQPPASKAEPTASKNPASVLPPGVVVLRGRVLLPNSQPAVGATVRAVKSVFRSHLLGQPPESKTVLATFTADSQGDFVGNVAAGRLKDGEITLDLWATLPGYGLALHPIESAEKTDAIIMSLAEEEPIRGRIIDLEGRPVRDARIEVVQYIDTTSASIDKWLATVQAKDAEYRIALLPNKPSAWVPDALITPSNTNSEGRFELKGIGRDRRVYLRISGPRAALTGATVITRPIKPFGQRFGQIFGSQFDRVVSPSVSLEGFVTDEESGKPIPGVRLDPSDWGYAPAMTDDRGHYRFDSLTPGSRFAFYVRVLDLPYFSGFQGFPIPAGVSLEPIRKDFKLKRGVWAVGRAYDRVTGKPVSGTVFYNPYLSNEFAQKLASNNPAFWEGILDCGRVDAEGRIRAVVIPGRGVMSLQCEGGDYRFNFGLAQIKEIADAIKARRAPPLYNPVWSERYQAVREINVAPGAAEAPIDLPVDPGQNVVLKFADAAGNRLAGVGTYGLRFVDALKPPGRDKSFAKGDSAILYATYPEETRTIWFRHRSSGLAKLLQFTAKAGETERTIILEPPAVATGRVVTSEGTPLSEIEVHCDVGGDVNSSFPAVLTDSQGRFRRDLPAGGPITIAFAGVRLPELTVVGGEQIDFGEIRIERNAKQPWMSKVHRDPEKRTQPPAEAHASSAAAPTSSMRQIPKGDAPRHDTPNGDAPMIIRGTVLRPDGKPATDGTVSLYAFHWSSGDRIRWEPIASRGTNAQGEFELVAPPSDASGSDDKFFFATANGLGCDYQLRFSFDPSKPLVMKLVPDCPIRGRILDLEGKPVAGARVHVVTVTDSANRGLGPWLDAMKSGVERYSPAAHALLGKFVKTLPGGAGSTATDQDGRFVLQGLGAERVVDLAIESDTTAYRNVTVVTRSLEPILRSASAQNGGLEIFGADFTAAARPTRLVVGTVRDAKTGKPLPGVSIESWRLAGEFFAGQRGLKTTSDAQGKYRLVGMPKGNGNAIFVVPNDDQPYFMREIAVPDADGMNPVTLDIELHRGLWITGRVTDKETGKPVPSRVNYWPFLTNTYTGGLPEFGPGRNMHGDYSRYPTRPDGTFRVLGLPGHGLVGAEAMTGRYRQGAGASEIHNVDREGRLRTYRNQGWPSLKYPTTMKEINPAEGTESVACDLVCDHGETVRITVLDPEGKPVSNCSTSVATKNDKATGIDSPFELNNLPLNVVQPLLIEQKERKLAKFMTFTLKEQSPRELTVQLEPCANVVGRLVDEDGTPFKGVSVDPRLRRSQDYWPTFPPVVCNSDGRFEYPNLPAGAAVDFFAQGAEIEFLQTLGRVSAPPGKKVDLGDIKLKRRR